MGNELYYSAFLDLTSTRPIGMALGPISLLTVHEYCIVMGIEGDLREDLLWIIPRLDAKYLEWSGKKHG